MMFWTETIRRSKCPFTMCVYWFSSFIIYHLKWCGYLNQQVLSIYLQHSLGIPIPVILKRKLIIFFLLWACLRGFLLLNLNKEKKERAKRNKEKMKRKGKIDGKTKFSCNTSNDIRLHRKQNCTKYFTTTCFLQHFCTLRSNVTALLTL